MALSDEKILEALRTVYDPEIHENIVALDMVEAIDIRGKDVDVKVKLTISGCPLQHTLEDDVKRALSDIGAGTVTVRFSTMTEEEREKLAARLRGNKDTHRVSLNPNRLPGDEHTVFLAVSSGKGGVGKSTVTTNLAVNFARMGLHVGLIDADIYGFSVPDMMGIEQRPTVINDVILPVPRFGVKVMSMGFFVNDNSPVIWRGPMLGKMLDTFLKEVSWGPLDVMLLDLPPGTGDVALDVHSKIPQSKEIIVTTPHATASFVAARAGTMALRTNHELLGVVENMSYYECSCGERGYVFGRGGGARLAEVLGTELLAEIPLGLPDEMDPDHPDFSPSIYAPSHPAGKAYADLAQKIWNKVQTKQKTHSS
ncbi:MAG: Mrp/NBP35 family ATP-binding protein [Candidatus Carbobacillus altaicus]|nr:Mrp/NBP35 family ATP-binding protein [Candidatus Carbobacillus altaicus]